MGTVTTIVAIVYGLTVAFVLRPKKGRDNPDRVRQGFVVGGGLVVGVMAIVFLLIPFLRGDM